MPPNQLQINTSKVVCVRADGAPYSTNCVTCEVAALIPDSITEKARPAFPFTFHTEFNFNLVRRIRINQRRSTPHRRRGT